MKYLSTLAFSLFGVGLGILLRGWFIEPVLQSAATTDAEVSELIARLSPLSKEPDGEWYASGLEIRFRGRHSVEIELRTPDRNEYHGRASTLQEAAKRITEPSVRIKDALQGWQK